MLKKLIDRFIFWIYDKIEAETVRRTITALAKATAERDAKGRANAKAYLDALAQRQNNCPHLKGGQGPTTHKDYSVRLHTFPDSSSTVKCTVCGKEWSKENKNFEEGLRMSYDSTNTPSASEVTLGAFKDRDKVCSDEALKYYEASKSDPRWEGPLGIWAGPKWIDIWAKRLKQLKRKKKVTS